MHSQSGEGFFVGNQVSAKGLSVGIINVCDNRDERNVGSM